MKRLLALTLALLLTPTLNLAQAQPERYATPQTRTVIEQMIEAHGGMDRWRSAPTLSYLHTMEDPRNPDDPWVSREVIEQNRRRLYQEWPNDGGRLAFDGEKVWTQNWGRPNPPGMMAFVSYFFVNLPWITQDDGVTLAEVRNEPLPVAASDGTTYHVVRMQYDPATTGASPEEHFDLYIDRDSHLLRGVSHTVAYRPLLDMMGVPEEVEAVGPLFKKYENYVDVNGLMLTTKYVTYRQGQPYGIHTVEEYALNKRFDESRLVMPRNGVVDPTFTN